MPNINTVEFSFDNGATWVATTSSSIDDWGGIFTFGGHNFSVRTACGGITTGEMSLTVQLNEGTSPNNIYASTVWTSPYPPVWTFPTLAGSPLHWPGGNVLTRVRVKPALVQHQATFSIVAGKLTITWPAATTKNNLLVLLYNQNGTDLNGGILSAPTFPTGSTVKWSSAAKHSYLAVIRNAASQSTTAVTVNGNPDMAWLGGLEVSDPQSQALLFPTPVEAHAANVTIACPALTGIGSPWLIAAMASCYRNAATSATLGTITSAGGGVSLLDQKSQSVVGGTPVFEQLISGSGSGTHNDAATYNPTFTQSIARQYDSASLGVLE